VFFLKGLRQPRYRDNQAGITLQDPTQINITIKGDSSLASTAQDSLTCAAQKDTQLECLQLPVPTSAEANQRNKRTQWTLTPEKMKNSVWLKPELPAKISLRTERLMRFEALKVLRLAEDKEPHQVIREE